MYGKQTNNNPSNAALNRTCTVFPDFEASGTPQSTPAFSAARPAHFPSHRPLILTDSNPDAPS